MPGANAPILSPGRRASRVKSQIGHLLAGWHPSPLGAGSPALVGLRRVVLLTARVGGRSLLRRVRVFRLVRLLFDRTAAGLGCAGERGEAGQVLR
ncbi:hypothetical protein GCM10010365_74480 [Streptomyces poonensis]|uniref:Uncharacterized protein n=1 Tax=Streptomyces poonensis TaxID=68255 RepID=A0A918QF45_9ACTN|nr:hypothetical protein GCM10010365_74480 [Streptomyces poonensis]